MRNNRTTVRSLVTNEGTCRAMSDGMILWENENTRKKINLGATATVLLGIKEDNRTLSKIYVGDRKGQLHALQLPNFAKLWTTTISNEPLRALCSDENECLMIGDAKGRVWSVDGEQNSTLVFETNRSISSIRLDGKVIRIQSGWEQCLYNRNGELTHSKDASNSFGENQMLRRIRERKAFEAQRREAESQFRLLPFA